MTRPRREADVNAGVLAAAAALALLVLLAGGVMLGVDVDPLDDGASGGGATTPVPTGSDGGSPGGSGGSGSDGGSGGSAGSDGSAPEEAAGSTPQPRPFDLDVLGTEPCGTTCREVTVRLRNERNATARDVVVTTRIYSGNTTDEGARVWEGRREVGTLAAGASTTATERVSLSYFEALSVKRTGGWVTVVTTVESTAVERTYRERRKVA
jgi:hypothetical protein